jgi:hypothetical protein
MTTEIKYKLFVAIFIVAFISLNIFIVRTDMVDSRERSRKLYHSWVKYDGNDKDLTYDEWYMLERDGLLQCDHHDH